MWVSIPALICFGSFGWGMRKHFECSGAFTAGMTTTAVAGSAASALHIFGLLSQPSCQPWLALSAYAASASLFWWCVWVTRGRGLAACFQGKIAKTLVQRGPYRWMRHPFYVAYSLAWCAGFAATGWLPLAVSAVTMALLYRKAALDEERDWLTSPHAHQYEKYIRSTGRFFPFSSARFRSNR